MIINTAFEMRTKGDYDDFIKYNKIEVETLYEEMKDFIIMIRKLVYQGICLILLSFNNLLQ